MGYDSCPMDGFNFQEVAKLIKLPDDHAIGLFVAVGKALTEAAPRSGQLALDEIILENTF
jgi:nitroreductase